MKAKEGVYNLMKEKRDRLHDADDGDLKDRIEEILFDLGIQSQEIDVSLKDEIGENDEPRRRDLMENNCVAEVEEVIYKLIENEEKVEEEDFDNVFDDSSQVAK
jgi:hypothetical protein